MFGPLKDQPISQIRFVVCGLFEYISCQDQEDELRSCVRQLLSAFPKNDPLQLVVPFDLRICGRERLHERSFNLASTVKQTPSPLSLAPWF